MIKKTIDEMHRLTVEAYHEAAKVPLIIVLDNVRSMHNVGAVFRTADAFRIEGIRLCGITCVPPNQELHKTALGAEETVNYTYYEHTLDAVRDLQKNGFTVYAVEQAHHSLTLEQALEKPYNHGIALVMGHEVFGVDEQVMRAVDGVIELPQYGTKHSLNVSVTAGIVLYAWAKKLRDNA